MNWREERAYCDYIRKSIGDAACLEQLAEEASELSQAALKLARILRNENPTPATKEEAAHTPSEELTDATVASNMLELQCNTDIYAHKLTRWATRVENKSSNEGE